MVKSKSLFLLVLFSLFSSYSRDEEHKKCERRRSPVEKIIKVATAGFLMAHLCPILVKIKNDTAVSEGFVALFNFSKEPKEGVSPSLTVALKTVTGTAFAKAWENVSVNSKMAIVYIPSLAICQGLTTLIGKSIF